MPTLGATLAERARERFVGRTEELAVLESCFQPGAPRVLHVSGVAGIGKTRLLSAFAAGARQSGAAVVQLDCRHIEPSEAGFLGALAAATGAQSADLETVATRLSGLAERVILSLDTYELFWLMDTYIRRALCPALGENVRVIICSRNGPVGAWLSAPEWLGLFRAISLRPLTLKESLAYLEASGIDAVSARRISNIAHGHPLALTVAAGLGAGRRGRLADDAAVGAVVDYLTQEFLADITDPRTQEALEAASVIRRVTESLLSAMLPSHAPADSLERLRQLPFVETRSDGLFIHDAVRDAVSTRLQAAWPERHRQLRMAAWRQLRQEVQHAPRANLWRYTADILYLLQKPEIREGFFPSGQQLLAVESAVPADVDSVRAIAASHEGPEAIGAIEAWWEHHPEAFAVCRDAEGSTTGFAIVFPGNRLSSAVRASDPIAAAWSDAMHPGNAGSRSLLLRRVLDRDEGEANSASRAAFGLAVKRTYMEMRPHLRYVYLAGFEREIFEWCDPLGFQPLDEATREFDGRPFHSYRLDMGPGSVDAWLAGLVAAELGIEEEPSLFDAETHEVVLPGGRVPLTSLEYGVMRELAATPGRPVSRAQLMERVWGFDSSTSSNVVDALILALRKKLGPSAGAIETVRGTGYRLRR